MFNHFVDENESYYKKKFYNDDGTLNEIKQLDRLEYLNKLVKSCTLGNKLVVTIKDIETDLPTLYL